ncbi:hypothetical protein H0H81_000364 [Sphagnurus paluster]|uniref:F-box domain-containing protein n=1 Tax=Sphagnurus paluster TaxID=117069 RepID=A0A9P7K386_9AGAR|nr:hypothetical protein H0H81_000364 [Sphagnurus paluster]
MNTTHRAPRKIPNLPPLPPELWYTILREATWVPYIMDPDHRLEFSPTFIGEQRRLFRQSLVTKRYLVRVCKTWNRWANEFLYECIYLGRCRSLPALLNTLTKSHHERPGSHADPSRGWWTKRLDIAIRHDRAMDEIAPISKMFNYLPNLDIINIKGFFSWILPELKKSCGPSLRVFKWCEAITIHEEWHNFLFQLTNLRMLHCPFSQPEKPTPTNFTFPHLESIYAVSPRDIPNAEYPSLRHLIIGGSTTDQWHPFLERQGAKLEVIQLVLHLITLSQIDLTTITTACPNLVRLDLSTDRWSLFTHISWDLVAPASIRILGLQSRAKQSNSRGYTALFSTLEKMICGSKLEYIQLIDRGNATDLRDKHPRALKRGVEMLQRKGLVLRDHEGLLMGINEHDTRSDLES